MILTLETANSNPPTSSINVNLPPPSNVVINHDPPRLDNNVNSNFGSMPAVSANPPLVNSSIQNVAGWLANQQTSNAPPPNPQLDFTNQHLFPPLPFTTSNTPPNAPNATTLPKSPIHPSGANLYTPGAGPSRPSRPSAVPNSSMYVPPVLAYHHKPIIVQWDVNEGTLFKDFIDSYEQTMGLRVNFNEQHMAAELKTHLKGQALRNYEDIRGERYPFSVVKDRLSRIFEPQEAMGRPINYLRPEIVLERYPSAENFLLQLIFNAEEVCKGNLEHIQRLVCQEFSSRLPLPVRSIIFPKANSYAMKRGLLKADMTDWQRASKYFDANYVWRDSQVILRCDLSTASNFNSKSTKIKAVYVAQNKPAQSGGRTVAATPAVTSSPPTGGANPPPPPLPPFENIRCWNCGIIGHQGYDCPTLARYLEPCPRCGEKHLGRYCKDQRIAYRKRQYAKGGQGNRNAPSTSAPPNTNNSQGRPSKSSTPPPPPPSKFCWSMQNNFDQYPHEESSEFEHYSITDSSTSPSSIKSRIHSPPKEKTTRWFKDNLKGTNIRDKLRDSYSRYVKATKDAKKIKYTCTSSKCVCQDHSCNLLSIKDQDSLRQEVQAMVCGDYDIQILENIPAEKVVTQEPIDPIPPLSPLKNVKSPLPQRKRKRKRQIRNPPDEGKTIPDKQDKTPRSLVNKISSTPHRT